MLFFEHCLKFFLNIYLFLYMNSGGLNTLLFGLLYYMRNEHIVILLKHRTTGTSHSSIVFAPIAGKTKRTADVVELRGAGQAQTRDGPCLNFTRSCKFNI